MKTTTSVFCALGFTVLAFVSATVRAQQPASVLAGVYTDAQAKRGEKVFTETCSVCHGPMLMGTDTGGPPLAGMDFINGWKDMSVGALLSKINMDMPSNAPGTLTREQYADVLAYVLSFNKYPAGQMELSTDPAALRAVPMAPPPRP